MTLTVNRKQRLRTLENDIRKKATNIHKTSLDIANDLMEIRDEHLWKEAGAEDWNKYLKVNAVELCGKSASWSMKLISAGEVSKRLPKNSLPGETISAKGLAELSRLAPTAKKDAGAGVSKDFRKLKKSTVEKVLKEAVVIARESKPDVKQGEPIAPSVRDIRKAVDASLGIDRAKLAADTKRKREYERSVDLADYLSQKKGTIEGIIENLTEIPADGWKLLMDDKPFLVEELAVACDELAELLRS